jgi:hypothetical protein
VRRFSRQALLACVLATAGTASCRGRPAEPPYAADQAPEAQALLQLTRPHLSALQVPKAKIRQGRSLAGTLMLAAQATPPRFAGSITAAGNELVSIAVNEKTYALRWLRDEGLRSGFYSGPPSACAIERVLGVALSTEDLVALLLGGGPMIADAKIVDQRWEGDRLRRRETGHPGHEVVTLQSAREVQELRFWWAEGRWWFGGTSLWRRDGDARTWLWSIEHEGLHRVGDHLLPARTLIRRPGRRGEQVVDIAYEQQRPDPPALLGSSGGADAGGDGGDTWEDDWDDDEWEDEGEAPPEKEATPPAPASPAPPAERPIPAVFQLDASGLSKRGDLCRPG